MDNATETARLTAAASEWDRDTLIAKAVESHIRSQYLLGHTVKMLKHLSWAMAEVERLGGDITSRPAALVEWHKRKRKP